MCPDAGFMLMRGIAWLWPRLGGSSGFASSAWAPRRAEWVPCLPPPPPDRMARGRWALPRDRQRARLPSWLRDLPGMACRWSKVKHCGYARGRLPSAPLGGTATLERLERRLEFLGSLFVAVGLHDVLEQACVSLAALSAACAARVAYEGRCRKDAPGPRDMGGRLASRPHSLAPCDSARPRRAAWDSSA